MSVFNDQYDNLFLSNNSPKRSLLEDDALKTLNSKVQIKGLPACHLNFGNLGNFKFSWSDLKPTPVNYKLFNKIKLLSDRIREINDLLITRIEELKCCNVASTYNSTVIPILEWVLKDFVNILVSIAETLMIGYQAVKAIECIIRPVPGNPWMKAAGYDWLNMIYSFIDGFANMYDWLMDGNIMDALLNPVDDFYKKLSSCSPTRSDNPINQPISKDRLQKLLDEYNRVEATKQNTSDEVFNTKLKEYNQIRDELYSLSTQLDTLRTEDKINSLKNIDPVNVDEITNLLSRISILQTDPAYTEFISLSETKNNTTLTLQNKVNNAAVVNSTLDKLIVDQHDPACSCITGLLELKGYELPDFVTVSTKYEVETLLSNRVAWEDKGLWQENIDKLQNDTNALHAEDLQNIYLSYSNIASKFSKYNSSITRDITADILVNSIFSSYSTTISFNYTSSDGLLKEASAEADTLQNAVELYTDSGKTTHKASNILTIFELNEKRRIEIQDCSIRANEYQNIKIQLQYKMEQIWNSLRRTAIEILNFEKYNFRINSLYDDFGQQLLQQNILKRLGTSFDIITFMMNFSDSDFPGLDTLKQKWEDSDKEYQLLMQMNKQLSELIKVDNVVIKVVDSKALPCGCDIICKLLQWLLDIILSSANAMIQAVIDKITQAVMNEHVKYILDLILYYAQCALDISNISKNIDRIKDKSNALKELNKQELNKMKDYDYCTSSNLPNTDFLNDKIDMYTGNPSDFTTADTIVLPDPTYGVPGGVIVPGTPSTPTKPAVEPGNTIFNYGCIPGVQKDGRSIPEMFFNCVDNSWIQLELVPRSQFEIIIIFKASDYINTAPVEIIDQEIVDTTPVVTAADNTTSNDVIAMVDKSNDVLEKANQEIAKISNAPIYIEEDCTDKTKSILKLCDTTHLSIESIMIIQNDEQVLDNRLGELSGVKIVGSDEIIYEYYPAHPDAVDGMVLLPSDEEYYEYTIRDEIVTIEDDIVETATVEVSLDTDQTPSTTTDETTAIVDHIKKVTYSITEKSFSTVDDILYETITVTKKNTLYDSFNYPDLEFVVRYKNLVNHLDIRFILDVLGYDEVYSKYYMDTYNGKYLDTVELGSMNGLLNKKFILSKRRLLALSSKLLSDNYIIMNPKAIADKVEETLHETDPCLLPESSKLEANKNIAISENILLSNIDLESSINDINIPSYVNSDPVIPKITTYKKSIPLLVLNNDSDNIIQIVDKKIYFQFKANGLLNSEPYIIDHELEPEKQYALSFKNIDTKFKLTLITPDKNTYSIDGVNTSGKSLFPTIVGGNVQHNSSFCGTVIDIILSKTGQYTNSYYEKSMMSYVPRTAGILFDFKVSNKGRVYNTILQEGGGFTTAAIQSQQKASYYGEILFNDYYQVLHGTMDNFFCKENLKNKSFSVSFWLWNISNTIGTIISDDINDTYIKWNSSDSKIIIIFKDYVKIIPFVFNKWAHFVFSHEYYTNTYTLSIQNSNTKETVDIVNNIQFNLMSLLSRYDYASKQYVEIFNGLLSTLTIFDYKISDVEYNTLHKEQEFLVKGMENVIS